jgi:exonuclease SbcC
LEVVDMIPISLKLRNFMAYRQAAVSFEGIHLAALTGENGAGKSSLLDSITWALWGKARARRDDELIRLGETDMEVEYTFELNENVYRVVRKRDATKRGRSDLSFQVADAGGWRTLTENSLRATEKKITQLLRLDYDTFINSAFLLQGRADEFTTKRPAERKKILTDILGLEMYDRYAEHAKQMANNKDVEIKIIEAVIQQIDEELAREDNYRGQLAAALKEAAGLEQERKQAEQTMELLRERYRTINDKRRQLEELRDRLKRATQDMTDLKEGIDKLQTTIRRLNDVLGRRVEIEAGLKQLEQAQLAAQEWDERLQQLVRLSKRKNELDRVIQAAQARVEADLRAVAKEIQMLTPQVAALDASRQQLSETEKQLDSLLQLDEQHKKDRDQLAEMGKESARLAEKNQQLHQEMNEIKEKLTQLEQAGSKCPVCQRPLEEGHRQEVLKQFRLDGTQKGDLYRVNKARQSELEQEQQSLKQRVSLAERELRQLGATQRGVAQLEKTVLEAEAAIPQLQQAKQAQATLLQQLASREFAADTLVDLEGVEVELAALGYDEAGHKQARQAVKALVKFESEARDLRDASERIDVESERLKRDEAMLARLSAQTQDDGEKITELEQETAGFADLTQELNQASKRLNQLDTDTRLAWDKKAQAEQLLENIVTQAKKRSENENKMQKVREEAAVFRELQTAFGKKGVQALLIENAIPEIENEANQLLSRMTDGRMNIRFETQRAAISSDNTIETLDILISDEVGTRDYELYSGGEAFRINFAIRIAISKVLARRAGARLQTLMIDEGFGTQDAQGRERLVEAINTVQDDFEKLIVITHIDELKDAFPVRIDVWKTSDGSQIAIR